MYNPLTAMRDLFRDVRDDDNLLLYLDRVAKRLLLRRYWRCDKC